MSKLINVPLPTWSNLARALLWKVKSDIELSNQWRRPGDRAFWLSRSAWSLVVIANSWKRLNGQTSFNIWVPDFFCNASLSPLREIGARILFYSLDNQMAPDYDFLNKIAEETPPDIFILVHYFGQPNYANNAADFCHGKNAWLIEDAAHVLRPIDGIGEYGDFVLYSPHKHLPIPDGALLLFRENGPSKLQEQTLLMDVLNDEYKNLININTISKQFFWIWLFKRIIQRIGLRNWRSPVYSFFQDINSNDSVHEHPKISSLAKLLLSSNLDGIYLFESIRRQNSLLWEDILAKYSYKSTKGTVSIDYTPYLLGVIFYDQSIAEKIFLQCLSKGIPVTTWPDLPPEVIEMKDYHQNAMSFRNTRIYLQVHQLLTFKQIIDCIKIFNLNK